jgi:hypothetical protein
LKNLPRKGGKVLKNLTPEGGKVLKKSSGKGPYVLRTDRPWRHLEAVEFARLKRVGWFNTRRLLEPIGYVASPDYE